MVIFFMVINILDNPIDSTGRNYGGFYTSTVNILCMIHLTNLKVLLETTTIHWKSFIGWYLFGWISTILFTWILNVGSISKAL